jgi:hypothetical protein
MHIICFDQNHPSITLSYQMDYFSYPCEAVGWWVTFKLSLLCPLGQGSRSKNTVYSSSTCLAKPGLWDTLFCFFLPLSRLLIIHMHKPHPCLRAFVSIAPFSNSPLGKALSSNPVSPKKKKKKTTTGILYSSKPIPFSLFFGLFLLIIRSWLK